ncbi:MAG: chromosome segregation protein SMC [Saprospiraceae bacterium]|nr:chromosome segregation protein SMC [Saprospiraceae bacterium]
MRLRQLHIKGFKSFANDTVIHFNEDVIGIVGPNGSGKSNIVDAIRWVLGEQKSKELRLEQMADVIFNGTKTRKEAPSATVELVFDNDRGLLPTEYQTVNISRTLYRSGDSEYRLNEVVCRLKDIKSLLIDTGIGSNSYAIISLGMVDDLLYDKDDSRRAMFEQAAGVSKYKSRKKETLSKLNSTSADLDRVSDLLFEIEGNMKSLEKQAKRTRKYFELKEEYKAVAVMSGVRSMQSLKERYKKVGQEITEKQDIYSRINAEVIGKEAILEAEKKQNLEQELSVGQQQRELNDIVAKLRNLENDKSLIAQKISFKKQSLFNVDALLEESIQLISGLNTEILVLTDLLEKEHTTEAQLLARLQQSQEALNGARQVQGSARQDFETKTRQIQNLQKQLFDVDKTIAVTNNNIESLKSESARASEEMRAFTEEKDILESELKEITGKFALISAELTSLREKESQRKQLIAESEHHRDKLAEDLGRINRTLDARQNEYDLLKSMIENFEGFPESLKYLSSNWRKDVPVLSDLLDVQEDYKSVIEQYLEPYLTYFVVQDVAEASEAIRMLGGAQKGKANFFLLNKLQYQKLDFVNIPLASPAINFVKVDARYQPLLNHLLMDTYIFDGSLEDFRYDSDYDGVSFLSKSGSFLKTRISISGGSVGLFEGKKIGRKKNLEKLEAVIREATESKFKLNAELDQVKEQILMLKSSDKSMEVELLQKDLNKLEQEKTRIRVSLDNLVQKLGDGEARIVRNKAAILNFEELLRANEVDKISLKRGLEEEEQSIRTNNSDLDQLTDKLNKASEAYNEANIELIRQQNLISNHQKDLEFKRTRVKEVNERIMLESARKEADTEELKVTENQKINLEQELIAIYQEKSAFQSQLNNNEQNYYSARNIISGLEEEIRILTRSLNQYQVEINQLKDTYQEVKFQINAIGDRIYIEFNVSVEEVLNMETDAEVSDEELTQKVEQIRHRLNNYGEINPMAMEAYEEIKARYDVRSAQRKDILDAKESLLQTLKEIESTANSQFMQAFEEIRANFINVFRSLFTEDDNCDLILLEPDNPLDSGIEIVAKPKGKKPKSLSQLSGGEKTLTATALLFALYLLKPAPFCIFDEVDAPLDDANIQKFNRIIQKFSERSQFIIVTHNKSTMASVDVLYGVYMQEMGISALTPVDFSDLKNDPAYEAVEVNN